jgi:hypothetical protein
MKKIAALGFALGFLMAGCSNSENRAKGVCMLVDTSGVFSSELKKAQTIISYLLATLQPNDTLAIANIGTERVKKSADNNQLPPRNLATQ